MVTLPPTSSLACASCGAELPGSAKFCLECGTPVPAATAERETRRTVTLLFTDVTGSTAMGEQLDPEAYRGVMGRYFAVSRTAIERHGGTVEKFVGDAVLAVFGVPEVREDDALRAVRAAYELNEAVAELSDRLVAELGVRLAIRTGVNTGAVVTGSSRAGGSFATGDAVNTAARLEQAAGSGEILLGATTYALVRDAVRADAVEPVLAKGKSEPVPAYRLLAVLDADRGRSRRDDVDLVGRERETRALHDALERTISSGRSHLITVLGPAGIGKSRLVTEFLVGVGDRADVAYGRCVSYGQGITYWPLIQALRDALRLAGTESDEITRHALEQALGDTGDREEVVALLLPLLGKAGTPGSGEQTFWSVRRLLEQLASHRPLVLTLDDLHWAEPTLLELLERVRDEVADLPLLLLCQARPELLEQHPGWGSGALNSMTFGLDPLSSTETGASVAALLDGEPPAGLAEAVATWSGGNPLFVEEIVAHLVESGVLASDAEGVWRLEGELDRATLPPTVSALLASRLDRLPADERDLLERLSVIGLEFTTADAEVLIDDATLPQLPFLLASLTRRDLVRRVRSLQGDSWAFKHVMIRDAAYDGLAKSVRAELHERFADSIAVAGDEAGGEQATFLAHHLEQAARYRRELAVRGPEVDALVDRAVDALVLAADGARDREEVLVGITLLQHALELGQPTSGRRRVLLRMLAHQRDTVDFTGMLATLGQFDDTLDDTATDRDRVFARMFRADHTMGTAGEIDPAEVAALARELLALAGDAQDTDYRILALHTLADCSTMAARWSEAAEIAAGLAEIGSPADIRLALLVKGAALFYGAAPLPEVAEVVHKEATTGWHTPRQELRGLVMDAIMSGAACSPEAPSQTEAAWTLLRQLTEGARTAIAPVTYLIDAFALVGDLDGAIAVCQRLNDDFREMGDTGHASTYILMQAALMLERGDPPSDALPLVEEAAGYTSPYDTLSVAYLAACRAIIAIREGESDRGVPLAEEALTAADRTDQVWQQADLRRVLAEVPRTTGDVEWERTLLQEADARYRAKEIYSYADQIAARLAELG